MVRRNSIILYLLISGLVAVLDFSGLIIFIREPARNASAPVKNAIRTSSLVISNFFLNLTRFPYFSSVMDENLKLKKENTSLVFQNDLLLEENSRLLSQLGAPIPSKYQYIPSTVISVGRHMDIYRGKKDGVKEGQLVVDGNILVGRVVEAGDRVSRVMLLSDLESRVPVKTSRNVRGVAVGQSGASVVMDRILQKDPVFLEDEVTSSGEESYIPDLLIGKITYIKSDDVSVYKQAKVETPVDYHSLRNVFIITE